MAFKIVAVVDSFREKKYYIKKVHKILFLRIATFVRKFTFPLPRKMVFISKSDAKRFISLLWILVTKWILFSGTKRKRRTWSQ